MVTRHIISAFRKRIPEYGRARGPEGTQGHNGTLRLSLGKLCAQCGAGCSSKSLGGTASGELSREMEGQNTNVNK
jgi:hypothetical protein